MKFNKSVYLPLFAACLSGLASCSDDDDFTWSEPVPSDCMDVYFADSNPTTYDVMSDEIDNLSFTVEVMRLNSAEAATVPLTVFSRSEAFECPSTIEFAAGENKAALEVKVNKSPRETTRSNSRSETCATRIPMSPTTADGRF